MSEKSLPYGPLATLWGDYACACLDGNDARISKIRHVSPDRVIDFPADEPEPELVEVLVAMNGWIGPYVLVENPEKGLDMDIDGRRERCSAGGCHCYRGVTTKMVKQEIISKT
ncbi:hypothetical protein Tco_1170882 [Tanacetum coccineum]